MIVMDDADIDRAVEGAIKGRFDNAGQVCTAVKRLYVHERIVKLFTQKLKERVDALVVGNGLGPKTDMGPLNSVAQREEISQLVEATRDAGEGMVLPEAAGRKAVRMNPGTSIVRPWSPVSGGSRLVTEEIFGPVLPVVPVPDLATAIREANNSRYRLGASVWTHDLRTTKRVFDEVHAGIIWVNRHLTLPPEVPFGGTRESGIAGRTGTTRPKPIPRQKHLYGLVKQPCQFLRAASAVEGICQPGKDRMTGAFVVTG